MLKPQSIRSGIIIYVNGKPVEKQVILDLSSEWSERQETLFRKTLKDGGEITVKGVVIKVIPQEKILNSKGEKDSKPPKGPAADDRF